MTPNDMTDKHSPDPWQNMDIYERLYNATQRLPALRKSPKGRDGLKFENLSHDEVTSKVTPVLLDCGIYSSGDVFMGKVEWSDTGVDKYGKAIGGMWVATGRVVLTYYAIKRDFERPGYSHMTSHYSSGTDKSQSMFATGAMYSYGIKYCYCKSLSIVTGEVEKDNRSDSAPAYDLPKTKTDRTIDHAETVNGDTLKETKAKVLDMCQENDWNPGKVMAWVKKECGGALSTLDEKQLGLVPGRVSKEYHD